MFLKLKKDQNAEETIREFKHKISTPLTCIGAFIDYCKGIEVEDEDFWVLLKVAEKAVGEMVETI